MTKDFTWITPLLVTIGGLRQLNRGFTDMSCTLTLSAQPPAGPGCRSNERQAWGPRPWARRMPVCARCAHRGPGRHTGQQCPSIQSKRKFH